MSKTEEESEKRKERLVSWYGTMERKKRGKKTMMMKKEKRKERMSERMNERKE
jgi:hypothetical protein